MISTMSHIQERPQDQSTQVIQDVWRCALYNDSRFDLNRYSFTTLVFVENILRNHTKFFDGIAKELAKTPSVIAYHQWRLLDDLFDDGIINWGRIMVAIALTTRMLQEIEKFQRTADTRTAFLEFFNMNLDPWIKTNGGWVRFVM